MRQDIAELMQTVRYLKDRQDILDCSQRESRARDRQDAEQIASCWWEDGVDEHGSATGHFQATGMQPECLDKLRAHGVHLPLELFESRRLLTRQERAAN